ncbi:hypothetical protein DFP94_102459 [Fontibacillus phaseoli]|uniref:Uncharacterized protein n=1 Tax=Fontibacillus phaseoli TaxID=1416533 RepID=A0A369BJF8_9BACL|nr:hypothetical protein DFP94_102459 [Fontibacillus phaseoli]
MIIRAATTEPVHISAFLLTSSLFCCSVGGFRFVDIGYSPSFITGVYSSIVMAFIRKYYIPDHAFPAQINFSFVPETAKLDMKFYVSTETNGVK